MQFLANQSRQQRLKSLERTIYDLSLKTQLTHTSGWVHVDNTWVGKATQVNQSLQCGHMHLLTSFVWDTCVGLLHCFKISMVV
jgi:hypothetical protein